MAFKIIPQKAFIEAVISVNSEVWAAFSIKETFIDSTDDSAFSKMIRELIFSDDVDVYCIERYRHGLSIDGVALHCFTIADGKTSNVPDDFPELMSVA